MKRTTYVGSVLLFCAYSGLFADEPWVAHTTFEDFASGTLGDGGVNIYVARQGRVELINRLDFNNDGYLDLFIANDHDKVEGVDVFVYWGAKDGPRSILPPAARHLPTIRLLDEIKVRENFATRLPSDGGGRSTVADLNGDGYPELIFCNFKHNYTIYSDALIYWNGPRGFDPQSRTQLPTLLAGGVVAEDFNGDGFIDLAFANRGNFEQLSLVKPFGNRESYVYWNGPTGFDVERRTSLPTITARDCASADVNGDGYPDLLFANNNFQEKSIHLYWGSRAGFNHEQRQTWNSEHPMGLHLDDLNRDGRPDLIVMHKSDRAELFYGTGTTFPSEPATSLPTRAADQCATGDLNGDGFPEIVFANHGHTDEQTSFIYWGSADGYSTVRRTELPTLEPTDVVMSDFNRDGHVDLAFANTSDGTTVDVNTFIYWNSPAGFFAADRSEVLGFAPDSINAADFNLDGHQDLVLINHLSGTDHRTDLDSFIYWGNPRHRYSPAAMTALKNCSGVGIADLNQDGFVDVVGGSAGVIHWGGADGFTSDSIDDSKKLGGNGIAIADLNRDGYLDLALPRGFDAAYTEPDQKPNPTQGEILWGSAKGFDLQNKTVLKLQTMYSQSVNIADVNRDGFLDLLFPGLETGRTHIFYGAADGTYDDDRQVFFQGHNSSTIEIADLNGDRWLDLVFGGGWDIENYSRPTRHALVMWGREDGYSLQRSLRLEAYDPLEGSVADLNKDGYLDIVYTNYHAYFTRRVPALIYWGGADKSYSESRRTALPAESSSSLTIADFNQDTWLDLFICNHVIDGDHTVGSNIHWGSPSGFSPERRQWVPSSGPHFGVGRDVGNIYDRRLEEEYLSAPLAVPRGKAPSRLAWRATTPHRTAVKFQLRAASSLASLNDAPWRGPTGTGSFFHETDAPLEIPSSAHWLQYRAVLSTPDGGSTPLVEEVTITIRD